MFVRYPAISYALTMRLTILIIFIFSVFCANAETVYKTVDEHGNIIFTDKPSTGSEEIKLKELQTIKNPNPAKYRPPSTKSEPVDANIYKRILITNPANDSGIRNNAGNVSISVSLEPSLRSGHSLVITLDGKEVSNGSASSVSLNNVDRGTHSIGASVIDNNGKNLISTTSSFSLLRASQ